MDANQEKKSLHFALSEYRQWIHSSSNPIQQPQTRYNHLPADQDFEDETELPKGYGDDQLMSISFRRINYKLVKFSQQKSRRSLQCDLHVLMQKYDQTGYSDTRIPILLELYSNCTLYNLRIGKLNIFAGKLNRWIEQYYPTS